MFKKKFLGGYGLLFGVLCCLFVGFLSTSCFASSPSIEELNTFFEFCLEKEDNGEFNYTTKLSIDSSVLATAFYNSTSSLNYSLNNLVFVTGRAYYDNNSGWTDMQAVVFIANNSFGNQDFLYLNRSINGNYSNTKFTKNGSNAFVPAFIIKKNGSTTYTNSFEGTVYFNSSNDTFSYVNQSPALIECNYILTTLRTASFYYQNSGTWIPVMNAYNGLTYNEYITPEPIIPSGDSSTTGTITDNNGDTTGKIDLSGIENGIGQINTNLENIENKIPTSGDIANSVTQANQNYWGSSGDLTGDSQIDQIGNNLNGIMADLSGDLGDNEVFNSIQEAEDGFLDLFRNRQEESAYDLKFEWNDFEYNGVVLIPKGSINISQLCRDNVQLGYIQGLIRIVFNFEVALTLIYQIWNLILATLGIDNPFLYEDYDGVERINGDTGEVHTTIVRRKRFYRKGGK